MTGRPRRRLDVLCQLLNRDPHAPLPRDIDPAVADRLFGLAVAGASPADLSAAAGDVEYLDGFARRRLATFDFRELAKLPRAARSELERLDAQIAPLARAQRELVRVLTAPTSTDDHGEIWPLADAHERLAAPIDAEHDTAPAAAMPENPPPRPRSPTPRKRKRSIE